jgi:hypothetical protein
MKVDAFKTGFISAFRLSSFIFSVPFNSPYAFAEHLPSSEPEPRCAGANS